MPGNQDKRLNSLKTMEAFTGVHVDVKKLVSDWLLLTYDIPHTKEGDKARSDFLREARKIGASTHTESVYLLPWTPQSEILALKVAKIGKAFLWTSKVGDAVKAIELTTKYDTEIKQRIKAINDRLNRINQHYADGKDGVATRMIKKTNEMIKDAANIASRRGSIELCDKVNSLLIRLGGLHPSKSVNKHRNVAVVYDSQTLKFERMD